MLPRDTIHAIFLNLNHLVDFQRKLLIGIESHAAQPAENQRFGHLFVSMEDAFSCYEPYCANFTAANDLVMQENQALMVRVRSRSNLADRVETRARPRPQLRAAHLPHQACPAHLQVALAHAGPSRSSPEPPDRRSNSSR